MNPFCKRQKECFLLSNFDGECPVRICSLTGDRPLQAKLASMGFTKGATIHPCGRRHGKGCRRFIVKDCPILLDEKSASCILCTEDE